MRTFAQQVAHVTQANYHYFGSFCSRAKPTAVDVNAIANLTSKDDLVKALKDSFAYGHTAIATITPQNAFQIVELQRIGATDAWSRWPQAPSPTRATTTASWWSTCA